MFKYLLKFKEPIFYIIVPLIICLILFEIIMIIYKKKTTTQSYEFKKAYFGNLIYLEIKAKILSVDEENKRISLSIKDI